MNTLLDVSNLSKRYPLGGAGAKSVAWLRKRIYKTVKPIPLLHAVDDVSFSIGKGESLGLVGESGCGKSTLVGLICRLSDPTEGRIIFDGKDIGAVPAAGFGRAPERADIQVVFQDPHESLNPRFTAFDCIKDPLQRLAGIKAGGALKERVGELAQMVGLPSPLLGRFPHQLSGGQKARVNIARAIATNPKLLVLDEPTSALDVSVQAVILKLLADLRAKLGMSYLFVSHDLNVVRLLCDRVMVMYLGKVAEIGPSEDIFVNARHPYTQALIAAIPDHRRPPQDKAERLSGEPRSPIDPDPAVCRFYGRCPRGAEQCGREAPVLANVATAHEAACHFAI